MKTYLTYGFLLALASFLLTLLLFACGMQTYPVKFSLGKLIVGIAGFCIGVGFIVYGIKARRGATPAGKGFSYGEAVGAGVLVQLVASIFGIVTTYLYFGVINPHFGDAMMQARLDKLEERGLSGEQLDAAESMIRMLNSPLAHVAEKFIGSMIFGTIVALIAAAFLKRAAEESVPPATS